MPLVTEANDWEHGVFLGSIMASEKTAAAEGVQGELRFDPMAMLPFCGYNYADYFAHWLSMKGESDGSKLPKIFFVNWFRRDEDGRFLWPGFGENSRVLKFVFDRCDGTATSSTPRSANSPFLDRSTSTDSKLTPADLEALLTVDSDGWKQAVPQIREHFARFGDKLPDELIAAVDKLESSLA